MFDLPSGLGVFNKLIAFAWENNDVIAHNLFRVLLRVLRPPTVDMVIEDF